MSKRNPDNERIKRAYLHWLQHADGKAEATARQVAKSILRLEEFTGFADFKTFDQKQAVAFKTDLVDSNINPTTVLSAIYQIKKFLGWARTQPGYKSQIKQDDIDYLNLSDRQVRAAQSPLDKPFPTLLMIERVVAAMPSETGIENRDRALIAFTAMTAARDGALVTLKLCNFDVERRLLLQDPRQVATKNSKWISTCLTPLNDKFEPLFLDYVRYLREVELFGDQDPLFPKPKMVQDENMCFSYAGLSREHWASAAPMCKIFKRSFEAVGLPPFTPHVFRNMIVSEAFRRQLPIDQLKAWSQNIGHESLLVTLLSYGKIPFEEQGRLVRNASENAVDAPLTASQLEAMLKKYGIGRG